MICQNLCGQIGFGWNATIFSWNATIFAVLACAARHEVDDKMQETANPKAVEFQNRGPNAEK